MRETCTGARRERSQHAHRHDICSRTVGAPVEIARATDWPTRGTPPTAQRDADHAGAASERQAVIEVTKRPLICPW